MERNKKSSTKEKANTKNERIDLNNYDRKSNDALRNHSDQNIKDIDRNLNEQMGGTDDTVASEPNHI
jgi:hypothetical protein